MTCAVFVRDKVRTATNGRGCSRRARLQRGVCGRGGRVGGSGVWWGAWGLRRGWEYRGGWHFWEGGMVNGYG